MSRLGKMPPGKGVLSYLRSFSVPYRVSSISFSLNYNYMFLFPHPVLS